MSDALKASILTHVGTMVVGAMFILEDNSARACLALLM